MKTPGIKFTEFAVLALVATLVGTSSIHAATVAYWRFESGPANTSVPHAPAAGVFDGSTPDDSGNGNSLSAWSLGGFAGFAYRTDVPATEIPQTSTTNKFSVKNTGANPAFFSSAAGSSPTGVNIQTMTPSQFTIEASYKPEASASFRTIVGRDARNVVTGDGNLAALYLQVRPDDSVGIAFTDVSGYKHSAYSPPGWIYGFNYGSNPEGVGAPWYNIAATCDGTWLKLYVDNVLVASTNISVGSPNKSLAVGTTSGTDWTAGGWSVGRGLYGGAHTDRAFGFIDEVRISHTALGPADFLFAPRPKIASCTADTNNIIFNVKGQPGASCYILQSANPSTPVTNWTAIALKTFDANGNLSVTNPVSPLVPARFYAVKSVIVNPPPGALTYSLNGDGAWPADVRARIIYAMDGAVAQYNRYGTFNEHITVNYNTGVPTAQASYGGWLEFGPNASYQAYRTALHETGHTLGMGTTWQWRANMSVATGTGTWIGANGVAQIQAFDGGGGVITSDGTHFWPYGLNYDNEGNTESCKRHVLMMLAFRKDMGIQ